ncbi:hypothetical protein [Parasphingorhabdus sp.]|jgi:hypothetical protein|uniref:hypothetical protein n=1 Tax=Parasphingorhabdus sp. TaxID=2709688 RepID=UPI0030968F2A
MNAYIASFMLLLFNAVGLAVPASAAAEERMIPEMGSAANLSEVTVADPSSVVEAARLESSDHQFCAMVEGCFSEPHAVEKIASRTHVWAVVAMRVQAGDKLEHEEGAP